MRQCEPVEVEEDGWSEWIHPVPMRSISKEDRGYLLQCCDCDLIHEIEFELDDLNQLIFRARRLDDEDVTENTRSDEGSQSKDSGEIQLEAGTSRPSDTKECRPR